MANSTYGNTLETTSNGNQFQISSSVGTDEEAVIIMPANDYKCISKTCCNRLSLRVGCMIIAALYALYVLGFFGILIMYVIILDLNSYTNTVVDIWTLNMAIFELYFCTFALVFLCLGLKKLDYRRILISKWTMIVYSVINIIIQIRIIALNYWLTSTIHVFGLVLPSFISIFFLHSYEFELWQLHESQFDIPTLLKKPPMDFVFSK